MAGTSATPGSYGFTVTDGVQKVTLTLTVNQPSTTTTSSTTTSSSTTTTTTATTTTRTTTTTTEPPTTTTEPPTTTTEPPTTTTEPPTTTTEPPPTTTTEPPTTTTTTIVPIGLEASGPTGGQWSPNVPLIAFGAAAAIAIVGALAFIRSRRSGTGATPAIALAWGRRRERKRLRDQSKARRSSSRIGLWWRTSGPTARWRDWRSSRNASKTVRRQIEERQRMRRDAE